VVVHAHGLHRVHLAVFPLQFVAVDELAQARVVGHHVVVLQVDLDEGLPVELVFGDLGAFVHEAGEIHVGGHAQLGQVGVDVARAGEQQAVPVGQRRLVQVQAGIVGEMRRAHELALGVVGPAVERADDVLGVAPALQHPGLAVAADVGQQFHAVRVVDQHLAAVVEPVQHVEVALLGGHEPMTHVVGPALEQEFHLQFVNPGVEIPVHRQGGGYLVQQCRGIEFGHDPRILEKSR
jgi:hypothetical protein